jgi:hypothetical protein
LKKLNEDLGMGKKREIVMEEQKPDDATLKRRAEREARE